MKYDVIIIGAGLGGLTAGAKLAKEGKRYFSLNSITSRAVVQQHSIVMTSPGEVGLHEMDGPGRGT